MLSPLAWIYFILEIFIVALIAYWEWSQAKKLSTSTEQSIQNNNIK
jgi:CDP-diglyceride synthetase